MFQTFKDFLNNPEDKVIILRHDVDKLPNQSLKFACIENEFNIRASYFFRLTNNIYKPEIINEIVNLGHEIGYHYEDLDIAKGNHEKSIVLFKNHLNKLRKHYLVITIGMHGSPRSKYDNRYIWKYYDYRDFGIIGEPYFDINFGKVLYITDTGRKWNGESMIVRDKLNGGWNLGHSYTYFKDWKVQPKLNSAMRMSQEALNFQRQYKFRSTFDIIKAAEEDRLPDKIMFTFHPQRWTNKPLPWVKELIWQNVKNLCKYWFVKIRGNNTTV